MADFVSEEARFNAEMRHGSARWATQQETQHLTRHTPDGVFIGYHHGRPLRVTGQAGLVCFGGARCGKLTTIIAHILLDHRYDKHIILLDIKGELAATFISHKWPCYIWNPDGLHGLPQHKINPLDHIKLGEGDYVGYIQDFALWLIPVQITTPTPFFSLRARELLSGICIAIVETEGLISFPRLKEVIDHVTIRSDIWPSLSFAMEHSAHSHVRKTAEEINRGRENSDDRTFQSVWGEITGPLQCLISPALMDSLSPPYTMSMKDFCGDGPAKRGFLVCPMDKLQAWAPILRCIIGNGFIHKQQTPASRQQLWILDECGQLGKFPLLEQLYTAGGGYNIRPFAIYQGAAQIAANSINNESHALLSSAGTVLFLKVRDEFTATMLQNRIGKETLIYRDHKEHAKIDLELRELKRDVLLGRTSAFDAAAKIRYLKEASHAGTAQQRFLRSSDEILRTPNDRMYAFTDDVMFPIYGERRPYFECRHLAGTYHPNPFHPPHDAVQTATRFGTKWRKVIRERVDPRYAHLPQYESGYWSYIEGFRP